MKPSGRLKIGSLSGVDYGDLHLSPESAQNRNNGRAAGTPGDLESAIFTA